MVQSKTYSQALAEEFAQALRQRQPGDPIAEDGAYTVMELCVITNRGDAWVRTALRVVLTAGLWEVVRVRRETITGAWRFIPAYRPKQDKLTHDVKRGKKK